jgi:hypothetical protein
LIGEKVLGAYAALGDVAPAEQAGWYRKAAREWGIDGFEIPLFAGAPPAPELVETFAALRAALTVTLVAQWATAGQADPAYGLGSTHATVRHAALLDAYAILQQCVSLSRQGIRIRHFVVHCGQRSGEAIPHGIAFFRSLVELRQAVAAVLPECTLAVEATDSLPSDHPIAFPAAKKACLPLAALIQTVGTVNRESLPGPSIPLILNWGRLMVNGDPPLEGIRQILASDVPLAGVILSGAGPSAEGWRDSHNSHLDPQSGFTAEDAAACAALLKARPEAIFLGMKCSRAAENGQLPVEAVLTAQSELLRGVG